MSKKDDRLLMRDVHFSLSDSVPDTQVHLSYITKEPATPENTIEVSDYTLNITENVNRFDSWQKFLINSEGLIADGAIHNGAHIFGNPEGNVNNDFPLAGWRRELTIEAGPGGISIEPKDLYISSQYNYELSQDMYFSSIRLHIHPSGDMPDGYENPGAQFQAQVYDPTVEMLVTVTTPPTIQYPYLYPRVCYFGEYTFNRKTDGTHNGTYTIPMNESFLTPSGTYVRIYTYTRSKPETNIPIGGYVLFLGVSEHGSEGVINFMNKDYWDLGNFFTSTDALAYPGSLGLTCPPGTDGNLYMSNFMSHQCGGSSGVPNIDIVGTALEGNYVPEFITRDVNDRVLPIDPVMGQVAMQISDVAINADIPSRPDIPLTWEYILRFDHQVNAGDPKSSISIVDEVGRIIPSNRYDIELLLSYDTEPALSNIFKIKLLLPESLVRQVSKTLSVKYNKYIYGEIQTNYSEIINPVSRSLPEFDYYIDYDYIEN